MPYVRRLLLLQWSNRIDRVQAVTRTVSGLEDYVKEEQP